MNCNCPVCRGRDITQAGIELAEKEVIPFIKNDILKLRYPNHPLPLRYRSLYPSLFAYSQALYYDRIHQEPVKRYYTDNLLLLKFKDAMNQKFKNLIITDLKEMTADESVREVCEFNTER